MHPQFTSLVVHSGPFSGPVSDLRSSPICVVCVLSDLRTSPICVVCVLSDLRTSPICAASRARTVCVLSGLRSSPTYTVCVLSGLRTSPIYTVCVLSDLFMSGWSVSDLFLPPCSHLSITGVQVESLLRLACCACVLASASVLHSACRDCSTTRPQLRHSEVLHTCMRICRFLGSSLTLGSPSHTLTDLVSSGLVLPITNSTPILALSITGGSVEPVRCAVRCAATPPPSLPSTRFLIPELHKPPS